MLTLIATNNYFGQHQFHIECDDVDPIIEKLNQQKWFKKLKTVKTNTGLTVFCFTNYDKANIERLFADG